MLDALLEEARRAGQTECCGLAAGRGDRLTQIFPATNELASPVAFEIPPRELFEIFRTLRSEGLDRIAIYHSHPAGANVPSARDIERAYYPEAVYLIISLAAPPSRQARAFRIVPPDVREMEIVVEESS